MNPIDETVLLYSWVRNKAKAWFLGANNCGQLGSGDLEDRLHPDVTKVSSSLKDIEYIGGGGAFSLILKAEDGQLLLCGNNDRGQQGSDANTNITIFTPFSHLTSLKVTQVAAGWDFVLALVDDGSMLSWGSNGFGQLGRVTSTGKGQDPLPGRVVFPSDSIKIANLDAGLRHAIAVTDSHQVFTWGHGRRAQLGVLIDGNLPQKCASPQQVDMPSSIQVVCAVAGMYHTAILTDEGSFYVWGCNRYGQCCVNPEICGSIPKPQIVSSLKLQNNGKITSLSSGWTHMLARTNTGQLYSWGRADMGQLGRESSDQSFDHVPQPVSELCCVKMQACGSEHNLALTEGGVIYAWGWNEHGICGTGDEKNVFKPQKIAAFSGKTVSHIGTGAGHSFCVAEVKEKDAVS